MPRSTSASSMRCRSGVIAVLLDQRGHMPASIKVRRSPIDLLPEDHHRVSGLVQRVMGRQFCCITWERAV
jgi:hypothetical protein